MKTHPYFRNALLIPVFLLAAMLQGQAQHNYIPFPDSSAIWVINVLDEHGQVLFGRNYFIENDTTIDSNVYHRVYRANDSLLQNKHWNWHGLYDDTAARKVYMCTHEGKEYLLYDFSLNEGDTVPQDWLGSARYGGSVIENIDTILIHGKEHLVFYPVYDLEYRAPYIEGIGSVAGLFESTYFFEGGSELVCLMTGPERQPYYTYGTNTCKLYHSTGIEEVGQLIAEAKVLPHPLLPTSILELSTHETISDFSVYNISGTRLIDLQPNSHVIAIGSLISQPGFYFYSGRTRSGKRFSGKMVK